LIHNYEVECLLKPVLRLISADFARRLNEPLYLRLFVSPWLFGGHDSLLLCFIKRQPQLPSIYNHRPAITDG